MTVESAFTTTNPEVIQMHREYLERVEAFHDNRDFIDDKYGRRVYYSSRSGDLRITGLLPTDEDARYETDLLAEGLRLDRKQRQPMLIPALRTAKGKKIEKEWAQFKVDSPDYPGMPTMVFGSNDGFSGAIYWPGYILRDEVFWCYWGTSGERVTGEVKERGDRSASGFDPEIWEQRKLSEFFVMKEVLDAENKAKRDAEDAARA